jgi:hypothetical protein
MNVGTANLIGNGLLYDGVNDFVNLGSGLNSVPTTPISPISFYFSFTPKAFSVNNNYILSAQDTSSITLRSYRIVYAASFIDVQLFSGNSRLLDLYINVNLSINVLYNVSFIARGDGTGYFNVNGQVTEAIPLYSGGFTLADNTQAYTNWQLGSVVYLPNYAYYANHIIYDLKIVNKALSTGEATQLYESFGTNLTGLTSNIVANYDFNQKQGNTLIDKSTNNLNGTLTNFANTSLGVNNSWVNSLGGSITY